MHVANDINILGGRDPSKPLTAYDGLVGALLGGNQWLCTTPNQTAIYGPTFGPVRVALCEDFRFGSNDHTLWPQPWSRELPHLGAVLRKPADPADALAVLWWDPTPSDFVSSSGSVVTGLGQLTETKIAAFEALEHELRERFKAYRELVDSGHPYMKPNTYLPLLERAMHYACLRLRCLATTYEQMRFGVTDFQRQYLELRALLDYLEIYKPRMDGHAAPATTVSHCIGVITSVVRTVEDFFKAGLPVWFMRQASFLQAPNASCNILEVVAPLIAERKICTKPRSNAVIYSGRDNAEKLVTIQRYCRQWLTYEDAFGEVTNTSSQASNNISQSSNPTSSSQPLPTSPSASSQPYHAQPPNRKQPSAAQTGGRDPFVPVTGPLAPYPIPAWTSALKAIIRDSSQVKSAPYTCPDGTLMISGADDGRKAQAIKSWVGIRNLWLLRLKMERELAIPSQSWRDFLFGGLKNEFKGDGKKNKRRVKLYETMLQALIPGPGSFGEHAIQVRNAEDEPIEWQGIRYQPRELPPPQVVREIVWELFELNFAHEFVSLDLRIRNVGPNYTTQDRLQRQELLSRVFAHFPVRISLIPKSNEGLAADRLQDRLPFLHAMSKVLKTWPNSPEIFVLCHEKVDRISYHNAMDLERAVATFYTQSFYNKFGRAPQIPYRLYLPTM